MYGIFEGQQNEESITTLPEKDSPGILDFFLKPESKPNDIQEKKITPKTIFVIEASSYQIEYSKNFKANYAVILNITPDHLERHGTFANYIKAKFKLIRTQTNKDFSFS